jgi:hypothetical protein
VLARCSGGVLTHRYAAALAAIKVRNVSNLNHTKGLRLSLRAAGLSRRPNSAGAGLLPRASARGSHLVQSIESR